MSDTPPKSTKEVVEKSSPFAITKTRADATAKGGEAAAPANPISEKKIDPRGTAKPTAQAPSEVKPKGTPISEPATTAPRSIVKDADSMSSTSRAESEMAASSPTPLLRRITTPAIGGSIFLGIISSAIWESAVKPGLGSFGRLVLTGITFGSEKVRDGAYSTAAMDPTALPSLYVLALIMACFLGLTAAMTFLTFYIRRKSEQLEAILHASGKEQFTAMLKAHREQEDARRNDYCEFHDRGCLSDC